MLVWTYKHNPSFLIPQALQYPLSHDRRHRNAHHLLETLDGRGGARATKYECLVGSSSHAPLNILRRFVNHSRGLAPHKAIIRVGVPYIYIYIYADRSIQNHFFHQTQKAKINLHNELYVVKDLQSKSIRL